MSKPSPVGRWISGNGLPFSADMKSRMDEFGVRCVEDLKCLEEKEWNDLFASSSITDQRKAKWVYAQHLAKKVNSLRCGYEVRLLNEAANIALDPPAGKRRKLLAISPAVAGGATADYDDEEIKITHLPEWAIREVIAYISKTQRALLALALTTDSASWREIHWHRSAPTSILSWFKKGSTRKKMKRPSAITRTILSPMTEDEKNIWEEINFDDNDSFLCACLTDNDVAGMLVCINAVKELKRLYLANCISITGRALEPLRGSNIIEAIDLSLGNNYPLHCEQLLPEDVIPILSAIIGSKNHSLRHLHFPRGWRKLFHVNFYFERFLEKYNQTKHQQNILCQNCRVDCYEALSLCRVDKNYLGIQHFTCYDCLSHYCYNCKDEDGHFYLPFCRFCEKFRCRYCMTMKPCRSCHEDDLIQDFQSMYAKRNDVSYICDSCEDIRNYLMCGQCGHFKFCGYCDTYNESCTHCDRSGCESCMQVYYCDYPYCETTTCRTCRNNDDGSANLVQLCNDCDRWLCFDHRLKRCKENWNDCCRECVVMIAPRLAFGYERSRS